MVKNIGRAVALRHIRAFVEVAEQGSFTVAADILAISQPALTSTINQLEDLLGVALFIRTTRSVQLTDIGKEFLPKAQSLLFNFDHELNAVHEAGKRSGGQVKIAVLPSLAISIIPRAVASFTDEQPMVTIQTRDDNAKGVHHQVLMNKSDFGITNKWEEDSQLKFTPIFEDRVGLVCHHSHDIAKSKSGTQWGKLVDYHFVGMSGDTGVNAMLKAIPDLPSCVVTPEYEVLTMVALASLIHTNLAVSALPVLAVPRLIEPPLKFIKLSKPTVWRQIYIVTRKSGQLSESAELLRAFLQNVLSEPWKLLGPEHEIDQQHFRS